MSADEPDSVDDRDSLVRAVAAAPALSPPAPTVHVMLVAASDVTRLRAVAARFGADPVARPDGTLSTTVVANDGPERVASCALAFRAAQPMTRIAIATAASERAASDRAAAILQETPPDAIRIDDATADLLDARFAIEGPADGRILVALRTDGCGSANETEERDRPAVTAMHPLTLTFNDIELERAYRESKRHRWGPFALGTSILSLAWITLIAWATMISPNSRGLVVTLVTFVVAPIFLVTLAVTRAIPARRRAAAVAAGGPLSAFAAGLVLILIQVLCHDERLTRHDGWVFVLYLFGFLTFVRTRFLFKHLVSWALVAIWIASRLVFKPITAETLFAPLLWIGVAQTMGLFLAYTAEQRGRRFFLLRRSVEEERAKSDRLQREAHEREVRALSGELRRQVAERAGKLADALARLRPNAAHALASGAIVEQRYRVVRAIGRGGMGAVYEVERLADQRRLAMKVLTRVGDAEALARFAREAQVAAGLDHPNVIAVVDVDVSQSGVLFLVMELIAGASLAAARTRYGDARWALPILRQIADALSAMHARGILHRDLKPANVLLDGNQAKVADFGLAGLTNVAPLASTYDVARDDSPALTRTGALMGTPLYMAPELADGTRAAEPATDVFSFGVVAHQILTGALPYASPPVLERLAGRKPARHTPIDQLRPDLPAHLSTTLDGCLAEDADERPSAEAIVAALAAPRL